MVIAVVTVSVLVKSLAECGFEMGFVHARKTRMRDTKIGSPPSIRKRFV